jgi:hypothetical protein
VSTSFGKPLPIQLATLIWFCAIERIEYLRGLVFKLEMLSSCCCVYTANLTYITRYIISIFLFTAIRIANAARGDIFYEASTNKYNDVPAHLQLTHVVVVTRHGKTRPS